MPRNMEIEKQIWQRSSLDADVKIDELKAEVHRLKEVIENLVNAAEYGTIAEKGSAYRNLKKALEE
jgi:hypothetical protein